ncbi:hypothetical protein EJV46_07725 [Roseococcus sp. SYP-B2431]|uniref:hypothetical protein n=1 Tax=Roseococcus sp. SYP-B2431 TaxID=2496640 RepID=UPI00103B9D7D|nr:hypothetical protein [Roseococcus sp. SYP-B2431]TCI00509.1 hypothetical protein EJV46_07725 [Roseococcus sp. SYP-B2431]
MMQVNRSFGRDLRPCAGLRALLATPAARIGTFDDLRLRQTSRLLVLTSPEGEAVIAEACPACGAKLGGRPARA